MAKSYLNIAGLPLGLRNNNPGNIRTGDRWQGAIGENQGFVVFENIAYGIRALAIDLSTKIENGYNTIELIIFRYAPPSENDTLSYINFVSNSLGIRQNQTLVSSDPVIHALCRAIINFELGSGYSSYITDQDIDEGISLKNGGSIVGPVGFTLATGLLLFAIAIFATMPPYKRAKLLNI